MRDGQRIAKIVVRKKCDGFVSGHRRVSLHKIVLDNEVEIMRLDQSSANKVPYDHEDKRAIYAQLASDHWQQLSCTQHVLFQKTALHTMSATLNHDPDIGTDDNEIDVEKEKTGT